MLTCAPGPELWVAKLTHRAFALWGAAEAHGLFRRTHGGRPWAAPALALLAVAPLTVELSRYVLLKLPTLTLMLATVNRF